MKSAMFGTGVFVFAVLMISGFIWMVSSPPPARSTSNSNNGWTWVTKDQGGSNLWKKCVGKDLIYEDDNASHISVIAQGCAK